MAMALAEAIPKWPTHTAVLPVGKGDSEQGGRGSGRGVGAGAVHPQIVVSLCRFYVALRRCHWRCCLTSNKTKYTHIKLIIKGPKGN